MKIFQFFIYYLKKREKNSSNKYSLREFSINIIKNLFNELKGEETFIEALKRTLDEKNMNINEFVGKKDNLEISEFLKILEESKFKINNVNLDMYCTLQKYKINENSEIINVTLIQNDLNKVSFNK